MATLKISDLSVGDWVRYEGKEYQVQCVDAMSEIVTLFGYCEQRDESVGNLRSIPIAAEILEANEIHRTDEDDNYAIFNADGLWAIKYSDGDWELSTPPVCRVDINYVHQLQHVLRLVGADKEINL